MFSRRISPVFAIIACALLADPAAADDQPTVPALAPSAPNATSVSPKKSATPISGPAEQYYTFESSGGYPTSNFPRIRSYNARTARSASLCAPHPTGCLHGHHHGCGCAGHGCNDSCCDDCATRWYVQLDALFLYRSNDAMNQTIIINDTTSAPILRTSDLGFDMEAGFRALTGWQVNEYNAVEASYFGNHFWDSKRRLSDTDNLSLPDPLGGVGAGSAVDFRSADTMDVRYTSRLNNTELNWAHKFYHVELLAGFRYIIMDEEFNINSANDGAGVSDYNIKTENDLYGGQIGARITGRHCGFFWSGVGKVGVYATENSHATLLTDTGSLRDFTATAKSTSFVGEIGLNGGYRFNDFWSLSGGYNVMWISDVALAPDQLDFDTGAVPETVDNSGSVFYHGANVRVEARW